MLIDKKRKLIFIWIVIGLLAAFIVTGYFVLAAGRTNMKYVDHHQDFSDGWTAITVDGAEKDVTLPIKASNKQKESVEFVKSLPDVIPENSGLIYRNYHQLSEVRIDDKLVFSYPNEDWTGTANVISDEWNLVPLRPEDAGKTISIKLTNSSLFKFKGYVGEFYIGSDNSLVQFVRGRGFIGVIFGIIVSVIGGMLLIISYIYRNHTNQSPNTAMGVAFLCFGIWITNRAKMVLFPDHSIYVYWCALMSLILVAPFVFLYSYYRNAELKKFALWSFRLCLVADVFLVVSSFFIKYDVEIIAMFAYGLICIALGLNAYSLFQGGFGKLSKRKSDIEVLLDRTEFVSNLIFPVLAAIEIILFKKELWTEVSNYFRFGVLLYSLSYMFFVLWRTFLVVQDRTIVTKRLHESQLELMMGQIQPHFVFNTLSSIRTLVKVDPDVSYNMLYDFSNYLRANIDNVTNMGGINFAAEVEHIKSYVNIEKVRFGDRLEMEYDIQKDNFTVPPLSIQPLVENAIKHGVCKKVNGGVVRLKSYEEGNYNVVEVSDTGVGFNSDTAGKVFAPSNNVNASMSAESRQVIRDTMKEIMESLELMDTENNPITIAEPEIIQHDLSGNGSEEHHSTGMLNIFLRLKEMSNAKVQIHSKEGEGTSIKVMFPMEDENI